MRRWWDRGDRDEATEEMEMGTKVIERGTEVIEKGDRGDRDGGQK